MAGEKLQAAYNDYPESASPSTPATGYVRVYAKSDGKMYRKDDAGTESELGGGGIPDVTLTDRTLSSNLLSPSTARYIRVSSQTGAASLDEIDQISTTGVTAGEELFLIANTNHFIDIRDNFGGGNIRLTNGTSLRLSEDVPLRLILNASGIYVEGFYDTGGGFTSFTVAGDSGSSQTITDGNTLTIAGGTGLSSVASATDTITLNLDNTAVTPASYTNADITVDAQGRITAASNGSSGAIVEIVAPTQLGAAQTTITFSSIPATYQDLMIVIRPRSTNSAGTGLVMTFNADTGLNYSKNESRVGVTGTEVHDVANNQTSMTIANGVTVSTGTTGYFASAKIYITGYAETAYTRLAHYMSGRFTDVTSLNRAEGLFAWENVSAAISSIELNCSAGDFEVGTIYALYGIGTAT